MLQGICKQSRYSFAGLAALFFSLAACKSESTGSSPEKAAYLADYEVPENHWGFMDTTGRLVIPTLYDDVRRFSEKKAAVNKAGLWGYIDASGKILIKPQFRSAYNFHEHRARVKPFDLPELFISPSGKIISSPEWTAADDFSNGRAKVKVGTHYGFIDTAGRVVINPVFTRAWNFNEGLAVVEFQGRQGIIDLDGKYIVQPQFDHLTIAAPYSLILGMLDNDTVVMDLEGHEKDRIHRARAYETDGKLVSIQKDDKLLLYRLDAKKYIPRPGFDQLIYLGDQRWSAKYNGSFHLMDDAGNEINATGYEQLNKFVKDVAVYHRDKFWGYLDASGRELTEPVFGLAWDYAEGFARAAFKDGLAFININQEIAFYPPEGALDMRDFSEGLSPVQMIRQ